MKFTIAVVVLQLLSLGAMAIPAPRPDEASLNPAVVGKGGPSVRLLPVSKQVWCLVANIGTQAPNGQGKKPGSW